MSVVSKKGTATRRAGQETATKILQAAHDVLETETLTRFTMRNIATRAGVSLANLQYYYPRREALIGAMVRDIEARYRIACEEVIAAEANSQPLDQFKAVLRFQLEDATQTRTRQFFIQLWALLGSMDNFSGSFLEQLYAHDLDMLSKPIAALHNDLSQAGVRERALQIASLVEGLMVVIGNTASNPASTERTLELVFATALKIACDKNE